MSGTSGPTSGKQFATYDPATSSWKMWPDTGLWGSIEYSETWPKTGYMHGGQAYELPTLVPRTIVNGFSSSRLFILAAFPDTESLRRDHGKTTNQWPPDRKIDAPHHDCDAASDAEGGGPSGHNGVSGGALSCGERKRFAGGNRGGEDAAHAHSVGCAPGGQCDGPGAEHAAFGGGDGVFSRFDWGEYGPAIRRWELVTRPAPHPVEMNRNGRPRLAAVFSEWMMGLPDGHVTGVPGLSRTSQLKAIGNGVCPQQAAVALHQLLSMKGE